MSPRRNTETYLPPSSHRGSGLWAAPAWSWLPSRTCFQQPRASRFPISLLQRWSRLQGLVQAAAPPWLSCCRAKNEFLDPLKEGFCSQWTQLWPLLSSGITTVSQQADATQGWLNWCHTSLSPSPHPCTGSSSHSLIWEQHWKAPSSSQQPWLDCIPHHLKQTWKCPGHHHFSIQKAPAELSPASTDPHTHPMVNHCPFWPQQPDLAGVIPIPAISLCAMLQRACTPMQILQHRVQVTALCFSF